MSESLSHYCSSPTESLTNAVETARQATAERIRQFLSENSLRYVVALIGDSATSGEIADRNAAIITEFFATLKDRDQYAIQTGGTSGGIPEIATQLARQNGIATIGLYPAAVRSYALDDPADLVIETPDVLYGRTSFGSETPTFVNVLDGAVVLGGSYGTRVEVSTILRTNKSRQDARRRRPDATDLSEPIYLCPVAGTGRSADELIAMSLYEDVGDCLPVPRDCIRTGSEAAAFINDKLPPAR